MGIEIGIFIETRESDRGTYPVMLFNRQAQQFVLDHIYDILEFCSLNKTDTETL